MPIDIPVADLHGGREHDGHVLQGHLVLLLLLDHVAHVDEDPLDQEPREKQANADRVGHLQNAQTPKFWVCASRCFN